MLSHSGFRFCLARAPLLFVGGCAVLLLQGCMGDDGEPIWRGSRMPEAASSKQDTQPRDSQADVPVDVGADKIRVPMTLTAEDRANSRIVDEPARVPLNLALPEDLQTGSDAHLQDPLLPNVFNAKQDPARLDLSGKLYWDESDEAKTKPLNEAITGGEVELRIRLP